MSNRLKPVLAASLILVGIGIYFTGNGELKADTEVGSSDPRDWPLNGPTPVPDVEVVDYIIPQLQTVRADMHAAVQQAREHDNLMVLVREHPAPMVREMFMEHVYRKEALRPALIYGNPEFIASFNTRLEPAMNGGFRNWPYLNMNAAMLRVNDPESAMLFWLAFHHELVHYQQWMDALEDGDNDGVMSFAMNFRGMPLETRCPLMWTHEVDAYRASCELRYTLGIDPEDSFCPWFQTDQFEQAFFLDHVSNVERGTSRLGAPPECLVHFARTAGHPDPNAFL